MRGSKMNEHSCLHSVYKNFTASARNSHSSGDLLKLVCCS